MLRPKMVISSILDLILPRRCPVCGGKLLRNETVLCTDCAVGMPLTYFWQRVHNPMADALNARIQGRRYACAVALYFYKEGYKNLSKALKYEADVRTGRYVAAALGRKILLSEFLCDVDVIVPVPLHPLRRLSRGYNQSEIIAAAVADVLNGRTAISTGAGTGRKVELKPGMLRRTRRTKSQVHLGMRDKAENVKGAFEAHLTGNPPAHILLVDDVMTSGSTLAECYDVLLAALIECFGPEKGAAVKISVATLAYVGD